MKTLLIILLATLVFITACEIMPRNTLKECQTQCKDSKKPKACYNFCDCIHNQGQPLDSCLEKYDQAPEDAKSEKF